MRTLDRLSLVDRIGRELQQRMTFADIDEYFKALDVDISKEWSGVNSKWAYVKEMLADTPDELVLRIADELDIPHTYTTSPNIGTVDATCWEPHHFRLFLSHVSEFKKTVAALQQALRKYGISAFVAHVDIEPTREWMDEIEAALASMDAMAALLHEKFAESRWCDQEVGYGLGRGVLIIPVIKDLDPYGFLGRYQGLRTNGMSVSAVAQQIFEILVASPKTRARMLTSLVDSALQSASAEDGTAKLDRLAAVPDLPDAYLERMREGAPSSAVFAEGEPLARLDALLAERGVQPVTPPTEPGLGFDDIPF